MANENKTVADIIAEWRGYAHGMPLCGRVTMTYKTFLDILSRIEKANKRELEAVGNAAKLREAVGYILKYADSVACRDHDEHTRHYIDQIRKWAQSAISAPARNCDKVKDHSDAIEKFEKWMDFSPKTADEQDAFFKEHWFEFAMWLIDMNESEVSNDK